jgi:hypothetical protein
VKEENKIVKIKNRMKTSIICLLIVLLAAQVDAQVSVNTKTGLSVLHRPELFVAAELQASFVSVSVEFRPDYIDKHMYANGMGLFGTIYRWQYQSSPYFSFGIITHGSEIDEITGEAVRSFPVMIGYRFYPAKIKKWKYIDEGLSFDIAGGIELMRNTTVRPYIQLSGNFILFNYKRY